MRRILIKNSLSGVVQLVINTVLVFVSISVFNKKLGSEMYGLFATISLIGNLNAFTNLGINSALLILLSEKGKCLESDQNIIVSFLIVLIVTIPLTVIGILFNHYILIEILNIPSHFYSSVKYLYIMLLISNSLIFIGQIFSNILDSIQKIYLTNLYQLIYNLFYNFLTIISILITGNLTYVGVGILISSALWFILISISALKNWGKIRFVGITHTFMPLLKKQTSLGIKVYLSGMIFFFYEPFSKILISHFLGVKQVGFFDIALKMRNQILGLIGKASQPLLPLISQLKEKAKIRNIIHDLEQKTFYIITPITAIVIFSTKPLISLWIGGENVEIISLTSIIFVSSYLIFSSTMIPQYMFLMAKGHAGKTILIQLTNASVNIIVIFVFFTSMGYYSFILSYALAIIFSFLLTLYYQKITLKSLVFDSPIQIIKLISIFVLLILLGFVLNFILFDNILKLIIIPFALSLLTVFLYRFLRVFDEKDIMRYLGTRSRAFDLAVKLLKHTNP